MPHRDASAASASTTGKRWRRPWARRKPRVRPNSSQFAARYTPFYQCGQIAQILLRALQYQLLPASARRHGLRPLIRHASIQLE